MKKAKVVSIVAAALLAAVNVSCASNSASNKAETEKVTPSLKSGSEQTLRCSFPVNGDKVSILKPAVLNYIAAMKEQAKQITADDYTLHDFYVSGTAKGEITNETDKVRVSDFYDNSGNQERSKVVTLVFDAENFPTDTEFTVEYGKNPDLSDAKSIKTTGKYVGITNLFGNTRYYWRVSTGAIKTEIQSFETEAGFRMMTADGIANIRDMGGRPVEGGKRIKQGLIFRGGEMVKETVGQHTKNLNEENTRIMQEELGIRYEYDLRGDEECGYLTESPIRDANHDVLYERIPDMSAYHDFFKMSKSDARWQGVKNMFIAFKNAAERHVYFHCWGGADRTGTTGFLLGGLLGMSYTDLVIDFELTSYAGNYRPHNVNDPSGKPVYQFPAFMDAMKTAKNSEGQTYWAEGKKISAIIEEILIDKAGLTAQDIADIKANLLEE